MNKRIKLLEKQCWTHHVDGALVDGQLHFDAEKFAELIVRECANVANSGIDPAESHLIGDDILEHFGVEE